MPLLLTPNAPYISANEKSRMKTKSMLKIENFTNRSKTNGIYHNPSKITYEDGIDAENQKLLVSLADKWYISLIIYLNMHSKPNIDL